MWFPTHIRRAKGLSLILTMSLSILILPGCASAPKFSTAQNHLANRSPEKIPVPIFDKPDSSSRIASSTPMRGIVSEPQPFEWSKLATSAGNRDIEGTTIGRGGYRTVIVGSLAGDDPLAIAFTEKLAKHMHENQIILGGVQTTVIRNPNPDGAVRFRTENENGAVLNRQFVTGTDAAAGLLEQEPEVRFLLGVLSEGQPQRVIHIRSIARDTGVVAASEGAESVAKDVAGWLNFKFGELPGKSLKGTLERFLSEKDSCEIVTFALPQSTRKEDVWDLYGDSVLNLLLDEDFETRKLARQQRGTTAADSRGSKEYPIRQEDD